MPKSYERHRRKHPFTSRYAAFYNTKGGFSHAIKHISIAHIIPNHTYNLDQKHFTHAHFILKYSRRKIINFKKSQPESFKQNQKESKMQ